MSQNIENETFDKQLFWLTSRRFISHAKSIIYLCNKKQNLEALMLLRPIIELVVNLRWVIEDKTGANRQQFMKAAAALFGVSDTAVLNWEIRGKVPGADRIANEILS